MLREKEHSFRMRTYVWIPALSLNKLFNLSVLFFPYYSIKESVRPAIGLVWGWELSYTRYLTHGNKRWLLSLIKMKTTDLVNTYKMISAVIWASFLGKSFNTAGKWKYWLMFRYFIWLSLDIPCVKVSVQNTSVVLVCTVLVTYVLHANWILILRIRILIYFYFQEPKFAFRSFHCFVFKLIHSQIATFFQTF